jgi:3-dehydroquinate dehydratase type I
MGADILIIVPRAITCYLITPMEPLHIGPIALGNIPRIIAVFDHIMAPGDIARIYAQGARLAEIRFDLLPVSFKEALAFASALRAASPFGIIGTLRSTPHNKSNRLSLFQDIFPLVDCIDIEIDAAIRDRVIASAKGKTIIVSHHDFDKMPDKKEIMAIGGDARRAGAHIVKIAGMAHSTEEAARLLAYSKSAPYPMIAIAMGDAGADARIEALKNGSLATYAYTGSAPVAPGQRSVSEIASRLLVDYPDFLKS